MFYGLKGRSVRDYVLQGLRVSFAEVQLINRALDDHVFTIWHVCLHHSALFSRSPTIWLSLNFCPSKIHFHLQPEQLGQSGRLMCSKDSSSHFGSSPPAFADTAPICQVVISLARSTLLGTSQRRPAWSPCSLDMSRRWWVSPPFEPIGPVHGVGASESFVVCDFRGMCGNISMSQVHWSRTESGFASNIAAAVPVKSIFSTQKDKERQQHWSPPSVVFRQADKSWSLRWSWNTVVYF